MSNLTSCDLHIDLAIEALKSQNPELIGHLKDFFSGVITPKRIEDVLLSAIYQLAETDLITCRWVLNHANYLEPDVDLADYTLKTALSQLQSHGFVPNHDFKIAQDGHLQVRQLAKAQLLAATCMGDRLLFEEVLHL